MLKKIIKIELNFWHQFLVGKQLNAFNIEQQKKREGKNGDFYG